MRSFSHVSFGLFSGSMLASFLANSQVEFGLDEKTLQCTIAVVIGSLSPDIDNQHSPISKALPFVSKIITRYCPHRTLMHSILGWVLVSGIVHGLMLIINQGITLHPMFITGFFACGYFSHLVLDTLTKRGVRYLYPLLKNPFGYPSLEEDRIVTGDHRWEFLFTAGSLLLFVFYLPIAKFGADASLGNIIGSFSSLKEVYLQTVDKEVTLHFEGYFLSDKSPVSGKALILEAGEKQFVVQCNEQIYRIGEGQGDIHLMKGKCSFLKVKPTKSEHSYRNEIFAGILSDFREGVRISGHLDANESFDVRKPYNGKTISATSKSLKFQFASKQDIQALHVKLATDKKTESQLSQELHQEQAALDSLIAKRLQIQDLYQRDLLYSEIEIQRKRTDKLETELEERKRNPLALIFSGKLTLRVIPSY